MRSPEGLKDHHKLSLETGVVAFDLKNAEKIYINDMNNHQQEKNLFIYA